MGYTALYRKFRPQTFSEMVGQEHITRTLKNQIIANRVGHAYLFNGGRGTGKGLDFSLFGGELQKIFNRLISAGNKDTLIAKFTTKAYLMYLVAYCLNSLKATDITSSASFVKSVTNYIYNNIQEHITLTDLADHFNMTKEHFIRTFKKETGLTPVQFILNKKFEIVRGLLNNTTLPISNIMFNVGFMDASSFSRAFKKYAGCSPSEYREKTPSSQSFEEEKARLKNSDPEEQQ